MGMLAIAIGDTAQDTAIPIAAFPIAGIDRLVRPLTDSLSAEEKRSLILGIE